MKPTRRLFCSGLAISAATAFQGRAWADAPAQVRDVAIAGSGGSVRVSVALDRASTANTFFLPNPDRFVVDIANARWALGGRSTGEGAGSGVVRAYRFAPRPDGSARLVLDLTSSAALVRQSMGGRAAPELSFDLAATGPVATPPPRFETPGRGDERRRTIVVDAGHGGRDPGALGRTGVREKDVVLDASLKLRDALESRGRYRVALTRDADTYVPLEDRVRFARRQNADLFISLHADSHASADAAGASVYTLSERGAARAQNMAAAQNWDLEIGEASRSGVVSDILMDLTQRETTNRSADFAQAAIRELGSVSPLLRNTHRNAGFFVLLAPDVPAVLIETGFLSNVQDERRLADPRAREAMAGAMANAVDAYFAQPALYAAG